MAEAKANIADAIHECVVARVEFGMPPTVVRQSWRFWFSYG